MIDPRKDRAERRRAREQERQQATALFLHDLARPWQSQTSALALYASRSAISPTMADMVRKRINWDWAAAAIAYRDPEWSEPVNPFALDLDQLDREQREDRECSPPWLEYFDNRERIEQEAREQAGREIDREQDWDRDR